MHGAAEAVWERVAPLLPRFTVEVLRSVDSTNSELMRRARAGQAEPVLVVAQEQTAGRGRLGRPWHSAPGASLTFSIGLALEPADWSGLSLAIGLAAAEALHPDVRLKWPNDLWVDGRKLAGILVETASIAGSGARYAIAGIGINVEPREPDPAFTVQPVSLRELQAPFDAAGALVAVAPRVIAAMRDFEREGFAPLQARYATRDALAGRVVRLSDGTEGEARGVDGTGALLVHTAAGLKAVTSSEVSVRPA
jgi:BirA family biotin operon repressor/biotin-[acetyl-CoA-carboxylase] ligase